MITWHTVPAEYQHCTLQNGASTWHPSAALLYTHHNQDLKRPSGSADPWGGQHCADESLSGFPARRSPTCTKHLSQEAWDRPVPPGSLLLCSHKCPAQPRGACCPCASPGVAGGRKVSAHSKAKRSGFGIWLCSSCSSDLQASAQWGGRTKPRMEGGSSKLWAMGLTRGETLNYSLESFEGSARMRFPHWQTKIYREYK